MKNKIMSVFSLVIVAICAYGPNVPSSLFSYSPDVPEELMKIRED